uniref:Pre-mRNA-splicing factor ISY1 homolog n=1 Tax=Fundulus heteroclitus TaxID=8078 RepID=A0A3Q2QES8_FUNHE
MARNAEKAMTALARFRQAQLEEGKVKERRPFLASECSELPKAEKWRRQIISEISKKVAQIQNAGLGEFRIRDLNDEINKLLREKGHWEYRIRELGGPDYVRFGPRMLDHEGKEVPGNRGYKYFGAARDLPGVRELFEKDPTPAPRKTRGELMKDVDAEYYGYRDEDDGVLLPLEAQYEKEAVLEAVQKWKTEKETRLQQQQQEEEEESIYTVHNDEVSSAFLLTPSQSAAGQPSADLRHPQPALPALTGGSWFWKIRRVCFLSLGRLRMRRDGRRWRERREESASSLTFPFRLRKRWKRRWSAGRRWSCCSATPARRFRLRARRPELCWASDGPGSDGPGSDPAGSDEPGSDPARF